MDNELQARLQAQEEKIDAIFKSVEKTRKYFLVTMWVTVLFFVLPLLAAVFILPAAMSSYMDSFQGLL